MTEAALYFEYLVDQYTKQAGVARGKMMSSPALKAKGKVFAFFHNERMTFKLGKDFDPDVYGLVDWKYLSPFKNKPPMKGWISVPFTQKKEWSKLTNQALLSL